MKQCTRCKETKPLDKFAKNKGNKSGIHSWCKQCLSDKVLEYRGGRVFKQLAFTETHKQCSICEEVKPYSQYSGTQ